MAICVSKSYIELPESISIVFQGKDYHQFLAKFCKTDNITQAVFTFPFQADDPLPYINSLDPQNEFLFFNEKTAQKRALAAGGSLKEITATGRSRFLSIQKEIERLKNKTSHFNAATIETGFHILGGFSFFDEIEYTGWNGFKSALFTLPKRTIVKNNEHTTISIAVSKELDDTADSIHQKVVDELLDVKINPSSKTVQKADQQAISQTSPIDFDEWGEAIKEVKEKINNNDFNKIVLARQLNLSSKNRFNIVSTLAYFRNHYPNCCSYLIRGKDTGTFLGCSPERLLAFDNGGCKTEALAGSMRRGKTEKQDQFLANKLLNSSKNLEEHDLVISQIQKSLQPIAQKIVFPEKPAVKRIANVHHLFSPIHFQAENGISPLQILNRLHPTPALGGYPQSEAVEYLAEKCLIKRGWFGAPIGWLNTEGSGEFTVAIRCGLVSEYSAKLFAGCGIVSPSTADEEWEESNIKFKPMLTALKNGQD